MSQIDAPDDNDDRSSPSVVADPLTASSPTAPEGPFAEPPDGAPVVGGDESAPKRFRGLRIVGAVSIVVIVAAVVACAFIRVPYYRFAPGSLYATENLIEIDGATAYKGDGGQIDFTTVSSRKASVLDALFSRFDESTDLIDAELVDGGRSSDQTRQENLEMMADSKQVAEVVALRKLGYQIEVEGSGALIKSIASGLPAERVLKPNDTVVAIDGQPIELGDDLVTAIGQHKPGDTVTLKVESAPGDPGHEAQVELVSVCADNKADEVCTEEDAQKPLLGVRLATRDTRFKLPFDLDIDTKDVGGPSAGLALTLGVIDVLTPGSLTGGAHVATTGTIDLDGTVGPIGGIKQKTYLAMRSGVSLFIVPEAQGEADEAKGYAEGSGMRVVGVKNLDEALAALADNGGRVDVVEQAAAANAPATSDPKPAN